MRSFQSREGFEHKIIIAKCREMANTNPVVAYSYKRTKNELQRRQLFAIIYFVLLLLAWLWFLRATSVKRNETERKNVLIYAPARSGSSFLGQIFNQHDDVFYLYEPLYVYSMLEKLRVMSPSQLVRNSLTLLHDCFQCNFTNHELYLYFISNRGYASSLFRDSSKAMSSLPLCSYKQLKSWHEQMKISQSKCQNRLEAKQTSLVCQKHKQVTVKVLSHRLRLSEILRWSSNETNVMIVYLLRDPRAVIASRLRPGWISNNETSKIQEFCKRMNENLRLVTTSKISSKHILRYEDLVENVFLVVNRLLKVTGLDMTNNLQKWLKENTEWQGSVDSHLQPFRTTRRNALTSAYFWRENISMNLTRTVEGNCQFVMKQAGYKRVTDIQELRNKSLTLLLPQTGIINI